MNFTVVGIALPHQTEISQPILTNIQAPRHGTAAMRATALNGMTVVPALQLPSMTISAAKPTVTSVLKVVKMVMLVLPVVLVATAVKVRSYLILM